jgi:hypothetical protein
MKQQDSRKKQTAKALEEVNELPDLSIAEKAASTHFETRLAGYRIFEPDVMVSLIRAIIGSNEPQDDDTGTKPSDNLAHLLIKLRATEQLNEIALRGLNEAIELCFLHSSAYQSALEVYRLESLGRLRGFETAQEAMQQIVERCEISNESKEQELSINN